MSLDLSRIVESGEIANSAGYAVHGRLHLRGCERPLLLDLTGNCSPDLAGRRIRFEARDHHDGSCAYGADAVDLSNLKWHQVGPTGAMTLTEPPVRSLSLEWFSQNGHVLVKLVDPHIEWLEPSAPGEFPVVWCDEQEDERADQFSQVQANAGPDDSDGLLPRELQEELDRQAQETDAAIGDGAGDPERFQWEMELMDELIEHGEGLPLWTLIDDPRKYPSPQELNDQQVEKTLKSLLARMAIYGMYVSLCSHLTPREAYRILLQEVFPEEGYYPEERLTQWVSCFTLGNHCPQCQAEFEREYEQIVRSKGNGPDENGTGSEECR